LDKIKVFGQDGEVIGETFARRAKQLVLKGRAKWLDKEFSAIGLLENDANTPVDMKASVDAKKEEIMEVYTNNGYMDLREPAEIATAKSDAKSKPSEDLLMYIAKRNVIARKELGLHLAGFAIAFVVLIILTDGFWGDFGSFWAGLLFAWAILIGYKAFIFFKERFNTRNPKTDPIKAEFERLKSRY
jgi:hypothetical protein